MPITAIVRDGALISRGGHSAARNELLIIVNALKSCAALSACSAVVLLSSCMGSAPPIPISAVQPAASSARVSLLYVSDTDTGDVYVFSYPQGTLTLTLTGFTDPAGECADKSGDVFITNTGASDIVEYAHGGSSPIATLKDPGDFPVGCSIDPATGNLAVTNDTTVSGGQGDLVIFKGAKGSVAARFTFRSMSQMLLCGYDASGDLFVDGLTQISTPVFAWKNRRSKLAGLTLDQKIGNPGGVQWDGKSLAIGDQSTNTIYQFTIRNAHGKRVGSTQLGGAVMVFQFWIDGKRVIGPDAGAGDVGIWKYPQGGSPVKTIGGLYAPLGATVSN